MGKGLLGAGKALVGQLTDGQKGVNVGEVLKGGVQGAASAIPGVGGLAAKAIGNMGGGQQQAGQAGQAAPALPGQAQPQQGGVLNNLIQQAHGGMVNYSAGGPTPEQLAEASQILANMGKEEKLAKYGMMSDEAILQEIARSLDGGEAAPAPYQPEASADPDYLGSEEQKQDLRESRIAAERERAIQEGGNRSLIQAFADEMSQIGSGLSNASDEWSRNSYDGMYGRGPAKFPDIFGAFGEGYRREEDADKARRQSGAKGYLDARNPFSVIGDFVTGAETTGLNSATVKPGRGMEFVRSGIAHREAPYKQFRGGKNPRVKLRKRY